MKKTVILLLVVAIAVVAFVFISKNNRGTETKMRMAVVGLDAPELAISDPSGKTYSLSDLKDSVVVVNFWATWCQPCREEMPSLQTLYNQFKDRKDFRMVTVLYKDDYQRAMAYMKQNNYEFPVLLDGGGGTAKAYGVTGVPETYILDKRGVLKEKMIGPFDWASPQAVSRISELLRD